MSSDRVRSSLLFFVLLPGLGCVTAESSRRESEIANIKGQLRSRPEGSRLILTLTDGSTVSGTLVAYKREVRRIGIGRGAASFISESVWIRPDGGSPNGDLSLDPEEIARLEESSIESEGSNEAKPDAPVAQREPIAAPAGDTGPTVTSAVAAWGDRRSLRVAVLPFRSPKGPDSGIADAFATELLASGFTLVERAELASLLEELKLGYTGAAGSTSIKRVGELAQADAVVSGSLEPWVEGNIAAESIRQLSLRLVDVETGRILLSSTFRNGGAIPLARSAVPGIVIKDVRRAIREAGVRLVQ